MALIATLKSKIKDTFGRDAFDWVDRSFAVDWLVVLALWGLSVLASYSPVFEREFSLNDTLISHPHTKQQIGGRINAIIAIYVPTIFVGAIGGYRLALVEIHHGLLGLWTARGLSKLVTEFMKNRVGRLRPDFLARCKWDATLEACTGELDKVLDGRRSFPSGHSSAAFAGMTFLSLFLAGKTASWCFGAPAPGSSIGATRLARFAITIAPLFWSAFVAISRVEDYRHHKEDVITGSIIGIVSAFIGYGMFWPSPFNVRNFTLERYGTARVAYDTDDSLRSRNDFELTSRDEPEENV